MAMPLSQPDPASPASVADASFGTARRGFDQGQVREFLRMVAAELGRVQERERFLERELRVAQSSPDLDAAMLDDATLTRMLGEETARVLSTARESAREIREKAEESAARMLVEASEEVARLREQADLDAARLRADATSDAESEIEMAKQQGREMVTEARAYRERVLSELARRRELAREQIEQLIHGRDRLIQAFERARLAAVDVVGELEPLGEPGEYVNLSPTTGPVPVMVPNTRPESAAPTEALPRTLDPSAEPDTADGDVVAEGSDGPGAGTGIVEVDDRADESSADEPEGADAPEGTSGEGAAGEAAPDEAAAEAEEAAEVGGDDVDELEAVVEEVAEAAEAAEVAEVGGDDAGEVEAVVDEAAQVVVGHDEPGGDHAQSAQAVAAGDDGEESPDAGDRADAEANEDHEVPAETESVTDTIDEQERDDVVVDLFARLRAGAAATDDRDDETTDETVVGDEAAATDETVASEETVARASSGSTIGDLDGGEAAEPAEVDQETPFRRRDGDLTPLIVASARKLKRVLADEQNGVLEVLRRDAGVRRLDELVPSVDDQAAHYAEAITAELTDAACAGARSIDADLDLPDTAAAAARDAAVGIVVDWLVNPLRDRLERCVDEGDGDNVAISRRVRSVYREWKTQHIDEQLDDVLRTAYGRGALGAAEGASAALVWLVDAEHPACPDCDDNSLSPPVTAGEEFPTGHTFAPAHPGCRCLVAVADR